MVSVKIGELVTSILGRDEGTDYLIYEILPNNYVTVIDGEYRPFSKPKKKNLKHLKTFGVASDEIATMIENKTIILDAEIRKAIKNLRN